MGYAFLTIYTNNWPDPVKIHYVISNILLRTSPIDTIQIQDSYIYINLVEFASYTNLSFHLTALTLISRNFIKFNFIGTGSDLKIHFCPLENFRDYDTIVSVYQVLVG